MKKLRLTLSIIPGIFAFFFVSVFSIALIQNVTYSTIIGTIGSLTTIYVIMTH